MMQFDSLAHTLSEQLGVLVDSYSLLEFRVSMEDHYSKGLLYILDQNP
jgi:hypothetical protein